MNNSKKDCVLGIFINENNQHIGTTAIHNITKDNNKKGEFGIIIGEKSFWGKNIGYESWRLMLTYGFLKLNLDSIETKIFSNNSSSLKLAEKLGFEYLELKKII